MTIAMTQYQELARKCLAEHGITAEALSSAATPELKRFRLEVDMGDFDCFVRPAEPGEDPLLPYAEQLIERLCEWPPKTEAHGISTVGMLDEAICFVAGIGFVDAEVASLFMTREASMNVLGQIPIEHFSPKVCEVALHSRPDAFEDMPDEVKTREMCLKAVKLLISNALCISDELMDAQMATDLIAIDPWAITMIPEALYTPEMIKKACGSCPATLPFINDQHLTQAMIEEKARVMQAEIERAERKKEL